MTGIFSRDVESLCKTLCTDKNFDIVKRELIIGEKRAVMIFIDGFIKDEVFEKILEFFYRITPKQLDKVGDMEQFSKAFTPYVEVGYESDQNLVVSAVLSGQTAILIEGINDALLVDTRTYPVRSVGEPEKDRSLRGARDGFVETFIFNTAMIRRRIRDPRLRMEYMQIGKSSKVDVAVSYIDGLADNTVVQKLKKRLSQITLSGISMTSQALVEVLVPSAFFNPFPKVRFTERPDFASACLLEGKILLVMDNSPSVMIFPNSIVDFMKETDDYYFPPLTGTYVRILRFIVSVLTVILTPLALILMNNPDILPDWLAFVATKEEYMIPFLAQFLLLEFVIDGLRLASLNTPNTLSNSLGIIGGLILSEFAINAGWFVSETVIYMAFVAIASYAQPSFEMGYAMKFSRIFILILSQLFGFLGFGAGVVLSLLVAAFSKTLSGRCYLYPIIPFSPKNFAKIFIRRSIAGKNAVH